MQTYKPECGRLHIDPLAKSQVEAIRGLNVMTRKVM